MVGSVARPLSTLGHLHVKAIFSRHSTLERSSDVTRDSSVHKGELSIGRNVRERNKPSRWLAILRDFKVVEYLDTRSTVELRAGNTIHWTAIFLKCMPFGK